MSTYLGPLVLFSLVVLGGLSMLKRFPPALLLTGPTYAIATRVASVIYLEVEETYLIETRIRSLDIGASERALIYNGILIVVALIFLKGFSDRIVQRYRLSPDAIARIVSGVEVRRAVLLAFVLLTLQLTNALLSYPYPLPGSGRSRQNFAQNLSFPFITEIVGEVAIFAPVIGAAAVALGMLGEHRTLRIRGVQLSLVHIAYLFLMGQRVNGGILIGGLWLATFTSVWWLGGRRLRPGKLARRLFPVALIIMFIGQADIADRTFAQEFDSPVEAVAYRAFALQGGVAYTAEFRAASGERAGPEVLVEDMETTLDVYMAPDLADAYKRRGVNLAGSLHGNSVLVFGHPWAVVPLIFYGFVLAVASALLLLALARGKFFALFPLSFLMLRVISVNARGTFESLINMQTLIVAAVGLVALYTKFKNADETHSVNRSGRNYRLSRYGSSHRFFTPRRVRLSSSLRGKGRDR